MNKHKRIALCNGYMANELFDSVGKYSEGREVTCGS
ncbi:hypothetical protein JOC76_002462 [Neobacillus cucumis]|nr:hypothetical protein [Neobacillus cucumis]